MHADLHAGERGGHAYLHACLFVRELHAYASGVERRLESK
jgi:hypothetical protein